MKQIKVIIFDMDGVIVDTEPIHMKIEQELFRELGLNISPEVHEKFVGLSSNNMWSEIIKCYNLQIPIESILKKKDTLYINYLKSSNCIKSVSGIKKIIIDLYSNNKSLILASSSTSQSIELILDKLNLWCFFSFYISGAELERSKPDPEIFLLAAKKINLPADQCCVIEDSENGVLAAKAANMRCIGYINPNSGDQDLSEADVIIDDFKKINIESIINYLSKK
jgi:beta-phosphoglucomutase-like phosphatase (HAD superfamily)